MFCTMGSVADATECAVLVARVVVFVVLVAGSGYEAGSSVVAALCVVATLVLDVGFLGGAVQEGYGFFTWMLFMILFKI